MILAYDGTDFYGAQVQPGRRTVGSELEGALARLTQQRSRVTFAGRTDRGVHASGQVAHCDVLTRLSDERLQRALNATLPADLAVVGLATAPDAFHARYDARWREYRYRIWNGDTRDPGLARTSWFLPRPLQLSALDEAAGQLVGRHDFAAFAGQGLGVPEREAGRATLREVHLARCRWGVPDRPFWGGQVVELQIRASGFLPQMVRTIVGALVEVGGGRREPAWVADLLRGRDRALSPAPAPPQGLTLWRVGYEGSAQLSAIGDQPPSGQGES